MKFSKYSTLCCILFFITFNFASAKGEKRLFFFFFLKHSKEIAANRGVTADPKPAPFVKLDAQTRDFCTNTAVRETMAVALELKRKRNDSVIERCGTETKLAYFYTAIHTRLG